MGGGKRDILTETKGFLVHAIVHAADKQEPNGAPLVLNAIVTSFLRLRHVFADGGYSGNKFKGALAKIGQWPIEFIMRSDQARLPLTHQNKNRP